MKKTIAVIFGSRSTEHDVSVVTAIASVIKPLMLTQQYHVVPVYITKEGVWYSAPELGDIGLFSSGSIDSFLDKTTPADICVNDGLTIVTKTRLGKQKRTKIDVVFPATHGTFGEDGSLMGLFRMANVPFVGCDLEASAIAMNKLLSHQVVEAGGIESHDYIGIYRDQYEKDAADVHARVIEKISYPMFVKPVHLGSSIGITKVDNEAELDNALEVAFHYDDIVIVEQGIANLIEVTVPVIGSGDDVEVGLVERPLFDENTTFDFETKYMQGGKKGKGGKKSGGAQGYSELPAQLEGDLYAQAEAMAKQVYQLIGCTGIARIDLLIDGKAQKVYFNEVNPLPGSLYAHNWRAAGVPTVKLVRKLVADAEKRHAKTSRRQTSFSTNYLKQF